jgi:pimeloyl-ACP methyl ester carboxylesterase
MKRKLLNLCLIMATTISQAQTRGQYAEVNGIKMYYEIQGSGSPLVLLHGGGSTIRTSFSRILPELLKTHRVIAIELQAHGHTGDRNAPETFQTDAADVVELLRQLKVEHADILGFSNGGQTALEIAIKYPASIRKVVIASAFYKRSGVPAAFWQGFAAAKLSNMPQVYQDEFLSITHSQAGLQNMFDKDVQRMAHFTDWTDDEIRSIQAPILIVAGDHDILTPEHAVAMYRLLPHGGLVILPGFHGEYMGEALFPNVSNERVMGFVAVVNDFLRE